MPEWINIIGPAAVGKTTLIQFLKNGKFPQLGDPSEIQNFYRYKFQIDKEQLTVDLRDNPGQQKYRKIIWATARNCKAFLLMFDLSDSSSFQQVKQWLTQLRQNLPSEQNIICAVGNKKDLARQIDRDYIHSFWESQGIQYVQISIKRGQDTKKVVDRLLKQMWFEANYKKEQRQLRAESIKLEPINEGKRKKKYC